MRSPNLIGRSFGYLTVIGGPLKIKGNRYSFWTCSCKCGGTAKVETSKLNNGHTKSCGCFKLEWAKTLGESNLIRTPLERKLLRTRAGLIKRCYDIRSDSYENYGGRGITVCEEWQDSFESFKSWSLANGYADNLSIDRINNNGNYEPSNCRWTTMEVQGNNRRNTKFITAFGETKTASHWSKDERCAVVYVTLFQRIAKGMNPEDAITMGSRKQPTEAAQEARRVARELRAAETLRKRSEAAQRRHEREEKKQLYIRLEEMR